MFKSVLATAICFASFQMVSEPVSVSALGETDSVFAGAGFRSLDILGNDDVVYGVAVDQNGRILLAGEVDTDSTGKDFAVVRLHPDGTIDLDFGTFGMSLLDFDTSTDGAQAMHLLPDGKMLVSGYAWNSADTRSSIALTRLTADGAIDDTFGTDGKVLLDVGGNVDVPSLSVDSLGRIIIAGYSFNAPAYSPVIARFLANGDADTSFDGDGFLLEDLGESATGRHLVLTEDEKLLLIGSTASGDLFLHRYNDDGSPDSSFSGDGLARTSFAGDVWDATLDDSSRLVAAGYRDFGSGDEPVAIRFTEDGELDASFGTGGTARIRAGSEGQANRVHVSNNSVIAVGYSTNSAGDTDLLASRISASGDLEWVQMVDFDLSADEVANGLTVMPSGEIVLAGSTSPAGRSDFAVARLTTGGALDLTLGAGWLTTNVGTTDTGYAVDVDSQGRIIAVGSTESGLTSDVLLTRYSSNGSLDEDFGTGGVVVYDSGGDTDIAYGVIHDDDGRILVTGCSDDQLFVSRFLSDGTPDVTFGAGGAAFLSRGGHDEGVDIDVDANGRILVVGLSNITGVRGDSDVLMARFLTDGTLDPTFGSSGIVVKDFDGREDATTSVALTAEGQIHVSGSAAVITTDARETDAFVLRYNTDGNLDSTFGNNGVAIVDFGLSGDESHAIALDSQGRVLIAGEGGSTADGVVARLTSSGQLDQTFGTDGVVVFDVGDNYTQAFAVGVTPEDGVLVAGNALVGVFLPATTGFVQMFDVNGDTVNEFGEDGLTQIGVSSFEANNIMLSIRGLVLDGRDAILVGSAANRSGRTPSGRDIALVRLDGTVAPSAPRDVSVIGGDGELVVSWVAPVDDGGASVSGYVASTSSGESCSTSGLSCTISGLTNGVSYSVSVVASNVVGDGAASVPVSGVPDAGEVFVALTPARIMDTRSGDMVGELDGSGAVRELQVTGAGGVPSSGVSAVALNVTAVSTETNDFGGFVTVFPCGTRPDASNLNFTSGMTIPNSVIAPVSDDGKVCFYVYGKAHLLADVSGYFVSGFEPLTPSRIMDTRSGDKVGELDGSGSAYELQVTGAGGVPASGVSAVALNVTAVSTETNDFGGFVTVFPCGTRPDASNLNFTSGMTIPNSVIAPVSSDGKVCFYVYGKTHLLADVSGYFSSGFESLTPDRIMDTRSGDKVGELDGSGSVRELQVTGAGGVPASGVSAVALNVTAVSTETNDFGGFVTVFPCGTRPDASNLNFTTGMTIPNSVIAPVSSDGKVCFYVYGKAHLLADVSGYFG